MNNHLPLTVLLVTLIVVSIAFGAIQVCKAQNTAILGYPYDTNGLSGGDAYSFYGARFTLNGDSTITSISCKLVINYNGVQPNAISHYRFAIYNDNSGSVGDLIAQTEIGSGNTPVEGPYDNDKWRTLNFASPVSLHQGSYWLISVDDSQQVDIHSEPMTTEQHEIVLGRLSSMDFPVTLNKEPIMAPTMYSIYASGQGVSSVLPPPSPDAAHPGVSLLSVNCQNVDSASGKVAVVGNLTSYGISIPSETVSFSYRFSSDVTWHQFAATNTSSDGTFRVEWLPPAPGYYLINATYWGDSIYSPVFTALNVLVTPQTGNQSQEVFSVESNSTVTSLAFNPQSSELSFSVTGESGTTGYAEVTIDKSLVADASAIQAFIDGDPANFTVTSTEDSWILQFSYHHSSHDVIFSLSSQKTVSTPEIPQAAFPLVTIILFASAVTALCLQRRQRYQPAHWTRT